MQAVKRLEGATLWTDGQRFGVSLDVCGEPAPPFRVGYESAADALEVHAEMQAERRAARARDIRNDWRR